MSFNEMVKKLQDLLKKYQGTQKLAPVAHGYSRNVVYLDCCEGDDGNCGANCSDTDCVSK